jgi:hypothetical protein
MGVSIKTITPMKKSIYLVAAMAIALTTSNLVSAQSNNTDSKDPKAGLKKISGPTREIKVDIDEDAIEESVERSMKGLEETLEKLEIDLAQLEINLQQIEIPDIHIQEIEIPEIIVPQIHIQPIEINIPEINIPDIDIDIPEINIPKINCDEYDSKPRRDSEKEKQRSKGLKKLE